MRRWKKRGICRRRRRKRRGGEMEELDGKCDGRGRRREEKMEFRDEEKK